MRMLPSARLRRGGIGLVLSLTALVVLWACGDENLFGPGPSAPPEVVSIELPDRVFSGQVLDVRGRVVGNVPIDSVVVRVRGAFADEAVVSAPAGKVDFTFDTSFDVPEEIDDTTAVVEVVAADVRGNTSPVASGTVRVTDTAPPALTLGVEAQQVALGKSFEVEVTASDNVGLREVGVRAFFSEGDTLFTETVAVSGRSDQRTFQVEVPLGAPEGELIVEAFAVDQDGNEAVSPQSSPVQVVFIDEERPTVTVSLPNVTGGEIGIGVPLTVQADFADNGGVSSLTFEGVGLRGDVDLGTDSTVARYQSTSVDFEAPVADSTVRRLLASVPADSTEETVHVVATATDAQGNVGTDTITLTVKPDLSPPTIDINQPAEGAGLPITDSVLVDVTIDDPTETLTTGVASVLLEGVSFVGDRNLGTFEVINRYQPKEVTFDPPVTDPTDVTRFLVPTGDTTATKAFIRVTATDAWGNVHKDSVQVQLGAPSVRFISPADGETASPGSPITIDVQATDATGVASIEVTGSSAIAALPLSESFSPAEDTARLTQTITAPSATGTYELTATAINSNGISGSVGPITIEVVSGSPTDDTPPELRVSYQPAGSPTDGRRVESTDEVTFVVEGRDNSGGSGVSEVGVTVLAKPRNRTTLERSVPIVTRTISPPRSGTFTTEITVPVSTFEAMGPVGDETLKLLASPDTVNLGIFAFMVDAQDNCAAAVSPDTFQSLECQLSSGDTIATGASGQSDFLVGVSGLTVDLPSGGSVADAVVDRDDEFMVIANIGLSRLQVVDLAPPVPQFEPNDIFVGAEPWGLSFSFTDEDTLYVANSGGTNLSVVNLNTGIGARAEDLDRRVFTPNTLLWDVNESTSDGGVTFTAEAHDFSDRPQFIAQDSTGRIVYSTRPTGAAPDGTIRLVEFPPDVLGAFPEDTVPEVILFTQHAETDPEDNSFAVSNVDRVDLSAAGLRMRTRIPFHVPESGCTDPAGGHELCTESFNFLGATDAATSALVDSVQANTENTYPAMFLPQNRGGVWNLESVGLSDTTFVSAAGDGSIVAIGEGATAPNGRIMLWNAAQQTISDAVSVIDLVGNASERVLGVDMNADGTFGVGRGIFAAYFFDSNLRLQGTVAIDEGGGGVAFHPSHADGPVGTSPNAALAFVPVGEDRIEVINTVNFSVVGRSYIRDVITGPLRATLPFTGDNAGLTCPTDASGAIDLSAADPRCVAVKLYGPSTAGGVVVIDVTVEDATRFTP